MSRYSQGNMKEFIKGIEGISHSFHNWEKFSDFCEAAAISLAQPFYHSEELEARYMRIAGKYGEDIRKFPKLLSLVVDELEAYPHDFLGSAFMQMDLGSHYTGQFFTPDTISEMIAKINFTGAREPEDGFPILVQEPACGSGGMIVHAANALLENKVNPQTAMHVMCQDISAVCFHMTYIQLSLLGISAEVCHGDTLRMETWQCWRTMMSFMRGYTCKGIEESRRMAGELKELMTGETVEIIEPIVLQKVIDPTKATQATFESFFT